MSKVHKSIKHEIQMYAKHMSLDAAASRVKRNRLGRLDFIVDEVMKKLAQ